MFDKMLPETESIVVKRSIILGKQLGVLTKRKFKKGSVLFSVKGPILSQPTKYSFSVDLEKHIDPLQKDGHFDFGHYLNHSCDPNTIIRVIDKTGSAPIIEIIARRNIKTGEELTSDYASLEYDTVAHVDCKCRTDLCRGKIHGFKDLPDHITKRYKKEGMIPGHILRTKRT